MARGVVLPGTVMALSFLVAVGRSPDGLDFQHCTRHVPRGAQFRPPAQLQRERYEADMKLIPKDGNQVSTEAPRPCAETFRLSRWRVFAGVR